MSGSVDSYPLFTAFSHLGAGLAAGLGALAAGLCIGVAGDTGVRACGQQEKLFVPMVLVLIFAEALALYGPHCGADYDLQPGPQQLVLNASISIEVVYFFFAHCFFVVSVNERELRGCM